jgi:hypothetical protein
VTPEHFSKLLAAYGADIGRWPEAERDVARAMVVRDPAELRAQLSDARQLDAWLSSEIVEQPDAVLEERIVATAPIRTDLPPAKPQRRRMRWLWPGAGLVGAGLAGSLTGAFVVSIALHSAGAASQVDWPERASAFGSAFTEWGDE